MNRITFVTGNIGKVQKLEKYLGIQFDHTSLHLDEIQELDLTKVVEHKAKQAYDILNKPVIVEDTALEFNALNRLPGTFVKHFIDEIGLESLASLAPQTNRTATARTAFAYFDGKQLKIVSGEIHGEIAKEPAGTNGFGWDAIFIPEGFTRTRSELGESDYEASYTTQKNIKGLQSLLIELGY